MTRWLRFLTVSVLAFFRPKFDPREEIRLKFWTWPFDADVKIVNNAAILSYTELGRLDYLIRTGLFSYVLKKGIYLPAAAVHVAFVRPLKRFQKLELRSRLIYSDDKWTWVEQTIYFKRNGEDVLGARSIMRGTCRKGRTVIPFADLLKDLGMELPPMEKPQIVADLERVQL